MARNSPAQDRPTRIERERRCRRSHIFQIERDAADLRRLTTLEGRILVHGEEESSGHGYLILEGTDARLHYVYYTPEIEAARNRGELRTNSFVQLRKSSAEGRPSLEIHDVGDTEAICVTSASCVRSGSVLSRQPHLAKRAPPRRRCSQNFSTAHRAVPTGIENGIEVVRFHVGKPFAQRPS